ncbi:MAG: hypothetical protein QOE87_1862, partial [Gaiellales bacterium]|nr:hypothetical protein [Gaiellales bacterium]
MVEMNRAGRTVMRRSAYAATIVITVVL